MTRSVVALCACVLGWTVSASAATRTVNAGGDLQAAIDAAQPGDTILLQAGATFAGSFKLPAKGGTTYITIRSSTPDSQLPPPGTRITPASAPLLAKIKSTSAGNAIRAGAGSSYWRLQFLEFAPSSPTSGETMIEFGMADSTQTTLSSVPHHLIVDRSYIHGDPSFGARRGIALNSGEAQVIDSWISDIKQIQTDTQGICGWNGPGPYLIQNNYIEAAAENIMFGGSDPHIPNLVPSNITIRRNYITKPLKWRNESWTIKNLLEFKNAQNVLVEGNTLENNWAAGQQGYSIVFTPRNQSGTAPWSVVKNITIQNNVLRHMAAVFNISGYDDENTSQQTQHLVIRNNLVYDVSPSYGTSSHVASGWYAVIGNGPRDITFDHNTIDNSGNAVVFIYGGVAPTGTKIYGLVINNNLMKHNLYGINGDRVGEGLAAFNTYAPDVTMLRNAMAGGSAKLYPTGNFFPTLAQWTADFVNISGANYQLVSSSLSQNAGTDGKDLGVDFAELNAAMNGSTPPPTPPPPSGSTPFTGTPIALPGTVQAENYDKGGEGIAYHDTTAGNSGGAYRSDNVDIRTTTDSSGSYNLKSVRAGEWLLYTVNVTAAGTYAIDLRIASSGTGGTVHLSLDGTNLTGAWTLPDTGGWNTWKTVTKSGLALPAGQHVLKLAIDANGSGGTVADINWIQVRDASINTSETHAYGGTPVSLPGTIQAEKYDTGGRNVSYFDTTSGNSGGAFRSDDVDIRATTDTGGGYNLKSVRGGEWLTYSVNVLSSAVYAIDLRAASDGAGGIVHFLLDGVRLTDGITLPDTGGWNTWRTITKTGVSLAAGLHALTLVIDSNGSGGTAADINWIAVR